ncbi:hypothetical protein ISN45_Aa06g037100 [Arabidopsis thaliana x Arabidopsis arenosa]|uniref:Uncharacterized protein n=1 Tax=Arabidopsis thaliana x Arabidopsis arenosa TaxID=1240361 RepID=A0A8T1Z394_9BRAS|nr:hypothetical protein ISN45_Aa06g037100 [Arabidopsis thaliana x Arabidopsis arenosa]
MFAYYRLLLLPLRVTQKYGMLLWTMENKDLMKFLQTNNTAASSQVESDNDDQSERSSTTECEVMETKPMELQLKKMIKLQRSVNFEDGNLNPATIASLKLRVGLCRCFLRRL